MENLRQVVENKIAQKLRKGMSNVEIATKRLQAEGKIARDFTFEVGNNRKGEEPCINFRPDNSKVGATFKMPNGPENFTINSFAIKQVAEKLKIPSTYLTALLAGEEWQKTLGYEIMNTHNGWLDRSKILVRAIGNEVRGVLSDSYRRLDSQLIFGSHIGEVFNNGAQLSDAFMDDTKLMVESILPQPIELVTPKNGVIYLAFGTRISTSDYGDGALELRSFIMQGVCLNGAVRESVLKQIHLGSKLPENMALSAETYRLDSQASASAIRDLTKNLYSTDVIKNRMIEVNAASDMTVDPVTELRNLYGVGKLLKGERDSIGELLMQNREEDGLNGESTLWKLTQGITAFANKENISERRRFELQEVAGSLFDRVKV